MCDMTFSTCRIPERPDCSIKALPKLKSDEGGNHKCHRAFKKKCYPISCNWGILQVWNVNFSPAVCMTLTSNTAMYRLTRRLYVALQRIHWNIHQAIKQLRLLPLKAIYMFVCFLIVLFYEGTNQKNISMLKRKLDGFHLSFFLISLPFNMFCLCNNMQPWTSFSSPLMLHLKGRCR